MINMSGRKKAIIIGAIIIAVIVIVSIIHSFERREYIVGSNTNTVVVEHHSDFGDILAWSWLMGGNDYHSRSVFVHHYRPTVIHHYHTKTVVLRPVRHTGGLHMSSYNKSSRSMFSGYHYHSSFHSSFGHGGHAR